MGNDNDNDDVYYTIQEVADRLGVSRSTVYSWIRQDKLRAMRTGDRLLRITAKDLTSFLVPTKASSGVVMTRRSFARKVGGALVTFTASVVVSSIAQVEISERAGRLKRENEARELFGELFGSFGQGRPFDYSTGRPQYWSTPYNDIAAKMLSKPLGLLDHRPIMTPSPLGLDIQRSGDLVLIGGPVSTDETMVAWEYEKSDSLGLKRSGEPIIPLRWYWILDESSHNMPGDFISYGTDSLRAASTERNWPIVDSITGELVLPTCGEAIEVGPQRAYRPRDNYLIITSLPNFLDPQFGTLLDANSAALPSLLIFSGTHAPGTRAAELLVEEVGLEVLESIRRERRSAIAFQALCKVRRLERDSRGMHRFSRIELCEVHPLNIDRETYRTAHDYAIRMLG